MIVRESKAQGPAELANDNALQISRRFSALRNRRRAFEIADPDFDRMVGSPQAGIPTIHNPYCMPERRRIVAQVRRNVRKNRGLLAAENKAA
jgi:hypothetical protein